MRTSKFLCVSLGNLLMVGCGVSKDDTETSTDTDTDTIVDTGEPEVYPLFFTTMSHMEGGHPDDVREESFLHHAELLRYTADLATQYSAIITVESEIPFATGCVTWGDNVLAEILEAGHGVSTHCDITEIYIEDTTHEAYVSELVAKKDAVDLLIGAENNLGCSGAGGGTLDWVNGMADAGFGYINGTVSMHYLSMEMEHRPDETWTDQYIKTQVSHDSAPSDLYDRIYLRQLNDSLDFDHDEGGRLVLSAGGLGRVDAQYGPSSDDIFTVEDVDALAQTLTDINSNRDPSMVAKVEVHLSLEHLESENRSVLEYFFEQMEVLQEGGVIQWMSQSDVYSLYIESL